METNTTIFAGGCFWCTESDLRKVEGVLDAVSGYATSPDGLRGTGAGPNEGSPSYENHEGYREAAKVTYDPQKTSFKKLCQFFLDHIDPTDAGGQFHDRGESYKTAIYFKDEEEKRVAEALLVELAESGIYSQPIVVDILPEEAFYTGEEYHQEYAKKNPVQYAMYRRGSGREDFVNNVCQIREEKKIVWKE